ncbi:MAG TPA: hypothetical protein VEF53_18925 [Patescibacteria group bacterium]|nr:hypothetical protein [Patescibacteria group bacterium]
MEIKINSKNVRAAGNKIIITKQQEEVLTLEDLENAKVNLQRQNKQIVQQMNRLKEQYDSFCTQIVDVDDMIKKLSSEEEILPEIPKE